MSTWAMAVMVLTTAATAAVVSAASTGTQPTQDVRFASPRDKDHPADFKPTYDRAGWEKRADFLRRQVLVSQGLWPLPPKTPLNAVVHGAIDKGDYTIEKVYFASLPGHYVAGNLYRPKGRSAGEKLPAILSPYGHWPNGRFIWNDDASIDKAIASGGERTREGARSPLQARCAELARMGAIVFHYDLVGYGDSTKIEHRQGFTDAEAILRLQSFSGLQSWNSVRALDFVLSLPDVDPNRIGLTGASGGATQCIMLGAIDPRPAASFPVVMISMNMQGGCVCENGPLLRVNTNNVELASLFAPKPLGAAAAKDWTHDFETRGLPEMKTVWGFFDAADRVEGKFFPYGHNYNVHSREMMYGFMNHRLKLGQSEPVEEKPFEPVPPKGLSVFDAEHPEPADSGDATAVRAWMTKTSDEQLAELRKDRDAYVKTLRAALSATVVDELPANDDVEASPPISTSDAGEWTVHIGRKGSGERVAAKWISSTGGAGGGAIVLWAHPDGVRSLTRESAKPLLDAGVSVVAIDLFQSGGFHGDKPLPLIPEKPAPNPPYAGFYLGHNRSVLANRVHDLLTATALLRQKHPGVPIDLVAFGEAGPAALLTKALAPEAFDRAAIDLNAFDFDQVKEPTDPMLFPGGLKYGGIYGFVPLCTGGSTLIANAPKAVPFPTPGIDVSPDKLDTAALLARLNEMKRP